MKHLICIKTFAEYAEAALCQGILVEQAVSSFVEAVDSASMRPDRDRDLDSHLLVSEEDVQKALEILQGMRSTGKPCCVVHQNRPVEYGAGIF